jgi:hypothetical protein
MPIEVSAIRDRRAVCHVELAPGATVVCEYRPLRIAELIERGGVDMERPETLQESREAVATQLVGILSAWDVTREGEPFPLDQYEIADTFDIGFLNKCMSALFEHYAQGKVTGELLSAPGIGTISQAAGAPSSPIPNSLGGNGNRASRRNASSSKSRSKAGSPRGTLQRIPNTTTSSPPTFRPATAS